MYAWDYHGIRLPLSKFESLPRDLILFRVLDRVQVHVWPEVSFLVGFDVWDIRHVIIDDIQVIQRSCIFGLLLSIFTHFVVFASKSKKLPD